MEYLIGLVLALTVSIFAALVGLDRDRGFYPTVMIVIASYYDLFAVMGGSSQAIAIELGISLVFIFAAALGFRRNLWIVVGALSGHGIYDFFHDYLISNPGVPPWWAMFCLTYDIAAAGFLAWLLKSSKIAAHESAFYDQTRTSNKRI
jgi:hypothetical protein